MHCLILQKLFSDRTTVLQYLFLYFSKNTVFFLRLKIRQNNNREPLEAAVDDYSGLSVDPYNGSAKVAELMKRAKQPQTTFCPIFYDCKTHMQR